MERGDVVTITEALRKSDHIRRKGNVAHAGTNGDGWIHIEYFLRPRGNYYGPLGLGESDLHLKREDLLADDWESRPECECCKRPYKDVA